MGTHLASSGSEESVSFPPVVRQWNVIPIASSGAGPQYEAAIDQPEVQRVGRWESGASGWSDYADEPRGRLTSLETRLSLTSAM
jgi:hypothetical protein